MYRTIYATRKEMVEALAQNRERLAAWFEQTRHRDGTALAGLSFGSDTFRAFHHMPQRPSIVFRGWTNSWLTGDAGDAVSSQLSNLESQEGYDHWIDAMGDALNRYWTMHMGAERPMPYGPRLKLLNLVMKEYVRMEGIEPETRARLISRLHVPLDSTTLLAVREVAKNTTHARALGNIPLSATMGYIKQAAQYNAAQALIREVASEAGVPPIYLDVLIWNVD